MQRRRHISLAVATGNELPTEFRLFTAGWNDTENGRYLFDAEAAKATMAAYEKWGVDLAIDLEHQMLEKDIAPDPTAKDARGWCKLELRTDGSLWAVNVSWTKDGAARLSERRQRYVSPAFSVDPDTSRVLAIVNVAITAIPATHDTPALVAASRKPRDLRKLAASAEVSFDDIRMALSAALSALYPPPANGDPFCDGPWVCDVFDASVVYQLKGDYFEASYTFDGTTATLGAPVQVRRTYVPVQAAPAAAPSPAAATPPPPAPAAAKNNKQRTAKLAASGENGMTLEEFAKVCKALGLDASMTIEDAMAKIKGEAPADDAPPSAADPPAEPAMNAADPDPAAEKDKPAAVAAAASKLMRLTGAKSFVAAIDTVETFRTSHIELETERQVLATERATLEAAERRALCVDLVTLGGRAPATVWADPLNKASAPKAYLSAMPIADFRELVADAVGAKGATTVKASARPPATSAANAAGLTAEELAICASLKCEPATYVALKTQRDGVKPGGN